MALKESIKDSTNVNDQRQYIASVISLGNRTGRFSYLDFTNDYLPQELREVFLSNLPKGTDTDTMFSIDGDVLDKQVGKRDIVIDDLIHISGPTDRITELVGTKPLGMEEQTIQLSGRFTQDSLKGK